MKIRAQSSEKKEKYEKKMRWGKNKGKIVSAEVLIRNISLVKDGVARTRLANSISD